MVCYIVPLIAAGIASLLWYHRGRGPAGWWLNLMLYGGALFGVVDHLWNGELLLVGSNPLLDIGLGGTITASILGGWGLALGVAKLKPSLARRMGWVGAIDREP